MSRARFSYIASPPTVYHAGRTLPLRKRQARLLIALLGADLVTVSDLLAVGSCRATISPGSTPESNTIVDSLSFATKSRLGWAGGRPKRRPAGGGIGAGSAAGRLVAAAVSSSNNAAS